MVRNITVPVKVKNLVMNYGGAELQDDGWHKDSVNDYRKVEVNYESKLILGHTYYSRAKIKIEQNESIGQADVLSWYYDNYWYDASILDPKPDTEYQVSIVHILETTHPDIVSKGALYCSPSGSASYGYIRDAMTIDLTELISVYPAFASLSATDKAMLLDTIPDLAPQEEFIITRDYLSSLDINISSMKTLPILVF